MKLFIPNIKGPSSVAWLTSELKKFNIPQPVETEIGEVSLPPNTKPELIAHLKDRLEENGLTILFDRKSFLCERVKHLFIKMVADDTFPRENYSNYISRQLFLNYTYIANVFSATEGITIEHFLIKLKIEKAKTLLLNNDYIIKQVAELLHYSSVGHFSNQFKKVTGQSPTQFRKNMQDKAVQ